MSSRLGNAAHDAVSQFDVQSYGQYDVAQGQRASALWQKACDLGEGYFCWLLGGRVGNEATSEQYGVIYDRVRAFRLYDRACHLRFECGDAGELAAACENFETAFAYYDSGCRGGNARDCKRAQALRGRTNGGPDAARKAIASSAEPQVQQHNAGEQGGAGGTKPVKFGGENFRLTDATITHVESGIEVMRRPFGPPVTYSGTATASPRLGGLDPGLPADQGLRPLCARWR